MDSLSIPNSVVLASILDAERRFLILTALTERQMQGQEAAATPSFIIDPHGEYAVQRIEGTWVMRRTRSWRDRREFDAALAGMMIHGKPERSIGHNRKALEWVRKIVGIAGETHE